MKLNIHNRDCLKFSFMNVIQADLDRMKTIWNRHHIRANRQYANGIPNYYLSAERGTCATSQVYTVLYIPCHLCSGLEDYSHECDDSFVGSMHVRNHLPIFTLAEILIEEENLQLPATPNECLLLYFDLIHHMKIKNIWSLVEMRDLNMQRGARKS